MAEIKQWITVNGVHIPIMEGESKMAAVGRFIKKKRNAYKSNYMKRKDKFIEDNEKRNDISLQQKQEYENAALRNKREYNKNYRPTIKGRAKTQEGKIDEFNEIMMNAANKAGAKLRKYGYNGNQLSESGVYARAHDIGYDKANDYMRITNGPNWKTDKNNFEGSSYKLKADKLRNTGRYSEKAILDDYRKNYTNAELLDHKRQLEKFKKDFKQDYSGRNEYIDARNYRSVTTVLAERKAAAKSDYKQYKKDHPRSTKTFDEFFKDRLY